MAYKKGVLFILELKTTFIEEDILKTTIYEVKKFQSKASDQLNKAKYFIENNFNELKSIESLNIDCSEKELNIKTLIISNIYQSDGLIFKNEHLKISLFELLIILKNDLYKMLVTQIPKVIGNLNGDLSFQAVMALLNESNSRYKNALNEIKKKDCNLRLKDGSCDPEDIISAIQEDKIWKHQDKIKDFGNESIILSKYDPKYLYLQ